jgi:hypothetical protein
MLKFLRRKCEDEASEPLCYELARELQRHRGPTARYDLVRLFEQKYPRQAVEHELDKMVEAGLLIQRELFFLRGIWDIMHGDEPALILPVHEIAFA